MNRIYIACFRGNGDLRVESVELLKETETHYVADFKQLPHWGCARNQLNKRNSYGSMVGRTRKEALQKLRDRWLALEAESIARVQRCDRRLSLIIKELECPQETQA